MAPLINKYTRLLYKDEKEDINSELILALWEAVLKMKYYEDDGKCLVYRCFVKYRDEADLTYRGRRVIKCIYDSSHPRFLFEKHL